MLNAHYRSLVAGAIDLFRQAAPVYGHPRAMAAKVYWDNFLYWGYTCQYAQQQVYRLTLAESEPFTVVGRRFLDISGHLQAFLRGWAQLAFEEPTRSFRSVPTFPSVLIDAHVAITATMSPAEALTYVRERLSQAEEIAAEIVLRVVQELGPARAQELLERVGFQSWGIAIPPARLEAELSLGRGRRKQLPPIARDMERTLGRVRRHPEAAAALELIAQGAAP
jgi:hypothetical protein